MDVESILEGLSQEERLALLERLIKEAAEPSEEELSVEERLERLERLMFGRRRWVHGPWRAAWHRHGVACMCC